MTNLEITVAGKTKIYHLPLSWDEVSLKQYQDLMVVVENKELSEIEVMIKTIAALTGAHKRDLTKAPITHLKLVFSALKSLTKQLPENELRRVIEIDGKEYGFIPDMRGLTFGEFVDLDGWLQKGYQNLVDILTILYRPVVKRKGEKYTIEDYDVESVPDRATLFSGSMSVNSVYGALVFFYDIGSKLINTTLCSLEKEKKQKISMGPIELNKK